MTFSDDLYDRYAEMSADHRDPHDPDVAAVLHDVALVAHVDVAEGNENARGTNAGFWAICARCVEAHQYSDAGWRPSPT